MLKAVVVRALCVFLSCSTVQWTVAQQIVLSSEQINDDDDDDDEYASVALD